MKKDSVVGIILMVAIIVIAFSIILLSSSETEDIELIVSDFVYENHQYFVNISLKNNQNITGWISDTYLDTVEGGVIDLTGAGIDEKVEPGGTILLQLFSAEVTVSITDSPVELKYTVFPSGRTYSVII